MEGKAWKTAEKQKKQNKKQTAARWGKPLPWALASILRKINLKRGLNKKRGGYRQGEGPSESDV
jgi:hypothetical protein